MNQGTDEAIPSDLQVAHRTPINLTADGQIQAIPVNADNAKHHMVLVINRAGGLAVLGGLDLRQLLKPAPGEQGAAEMVEILRLVAQVDVAGIDDDNVNATERLHGAIREYVSMKRQAELQARAELASRRGGADGAQLAEADAAFRALGDVLPEYVGAAQALAQIRGVLERTLRRTPDPARSTAQLALEVEAMVQRLGTGEARQPESDVELHDRLVRERAPSSDGQIIAAVKLALGEVEVRLHKPGAAMLRVLVPATVPPADCDAALELVRSSLPLGISARIEQEPGLPPEGYTVAESEEGENPGAGTWGWIGAADSRAEFDSEAGAVDDAWEAWAIVEEAKRDKAGE